MAALGFFRKHQKLVFGMMVFLMMLFLVTIGGVDPFVQMFTPNPEKRVVGTADGVKITAGQRLQAQKEIELLSRYLQLGDVYRVLGMPGAPVAGEREFIILQQNNDPALCWMLLTQEARKMGIQVGDVMVTDFLEKTLGYDKATLDRLEVQMRRDGMSDKDLRLAVGNYLAVSQAFTLVAGGVAETEPQVRAQYRDIMQQLAVAMVPFKAADYAKNVGEPTETDLRTLFNDCRSFFPGAPDNPTDFKFGYRLPARVQLECVYINWEDIQKSVKIDDDEIVQYWNEHRGELSVSVPVPPASQPTTGPAPLPEFKKVPATQPGDAREQIVETLREQKANAVLEGDVTKLVNLIQEYQKAASATPTTGSSQSPVARAAEEMLRNGVKLDYRVTGLMSREQVQADPILGGAGMGEGYQRTMLTDAAFSVKELHVGQPRNITLTEIGRMFSPPMDVQGRFRGKVLWRVMEAKDAAVPETMTPEIQQQVVADWKVKAAYMEARKAAEAALNVAGEKGLAEAAKQAGKTVSQTEPLPRKVLGRNQLLFAIMQAANEIYTYMRQPEGRPLPEYIKSIPPRMYAEAVRDAPFSIAAPNVPMVSPEASGEFMAGVFELAPTGEAANVEIPVATQPASAPASQAVAATGTQPTSAPAVSPTSMPAPDGTVKLVSLPSDRTVFVVQRVGYVPAYEGAFEKVQPSMVGMLNGVRVQGLMLQWFAQSDILQRTGYVAEAGEEPQ